MEKENRKNGKMENRKKNEKHPKIQAKKITT